MQEKNENCVVFIQKYFEVLNVWSFEVLGKMFVVERGSELEKIGIKLEWLKLAEEMTLEFV